MKLTLFLAALLFTPFTQAQPVLNVSNSVFGQYILILSGTCALERVSIIRFDNDQYGSFDENQRYWFAKLAPDAIRIFNLVREEGCA